MSGLDNTFGKVEPWMLGCCSGNTDPNIHPFYSTMKFASGPFNIHSPVCLLEEKEDWNIEKIFFRETLRNVLFSLEMQSDPAFDLK